MNIIFKRFLAFFLSLFLVISSTTMSYAASPAGWSASASDAVIAGATATITAFKGSGSKAFKAVIAHKPTAVAVGKEIVKGGGALALAYAMSKILDAGVDWVLDPENNRVSYTEPNSAPVGALPSDKDYDFFDSRKPSVKYPTRRLACDAIAATIAGIWTFHSYHSDGGCRYTTGNPPSANIYGMGEGKSLKVGGSTVPDANKKYIPIDTVAAQVISNAEAGHAGSQDFVKAVAVGQANAGDLDTALEAVSEPTTDTQDPDAPPKDETKPFDDTGILGALAGIKAAIAGVLAAVTGLSDFFTAEPEPPKPEDTELDIPIPEVLPTDTDINFGGSCPSSFEFNGAIFGNSINIVLLDMPKFCGFLSTFVKYPVYAVSSLFALYILGGRRDV